MKKKLLTNSFPQKKKTQFQREISKLKKEVILEGFFSCQKMRGKKIKITKFIHIFGLIV
jgi:hypothetical protein